MSTKVHPEFLEMRRRELAEHYSCYIVYTTLEAPMNELKITALTENHAKEIVIKLLKRMSISDYDILDSVFQYEYEEPIKRLI